MDKTGQTHPAREGFALCAPGAGGAGCEPTRAGSAVGPGSAPSRWSRGSVTGETLAAVSARGKATCAAARQPSPSR